MLNSSTSNQDVYEKNKKKIKKNYIGFIDECRKQFLPETIINVGLLSVITEDNNETKEDFVNQLKDKFIGNLFIYDVSDLKVDFKKGLDYFSKYRDIDIIFVLYDLDEDDIMMVSTASNIQYMIKRDEKNCPFIVSVNCCEGGVPLPHELSNIRSKSIKSAIDKTVKRNSDEYKQKVASLMGKAKSLYDIYYKYNWEQVEYRKSIIKEIKGDMDEMRERNMLVEKKTMEVLRGYLDVHKKHEMVIAQSILLSPEISDICKDYELIIASVNEIKKMKE